MKKVAIFAIGTHGDIRPFVALGIEFKAQGYLVTLQQMKKIMLFVKKRVLIMQLFQEI